MQEFAAFLGQIEDIRVNRLEDRLIPKVPFPHTHNFYHLLVITTGTGWHEIDFVRHRVKAGSCFIMKPGQVHSWKLAKNACGFVIEFESHVPSRALKGDDFLLLPVRAQKDIYSLLSVMLSQYENRDSVHEQVLSLLLSVLLLFLEQELDPVLTGPSDLLSKFLSLVESNFRKEHQVEYYAQKLKIPTKVFTMRLTRANGGASPRAEIQHRCLLEAKRLLAYSEPSVNEVGASVGFEDPNYFARFFRLKTKLTPRGFSPKSAFSVVVLAGRLRNQTYALWFSC